MAERPPASPDGGPRATFRVHLGKAFTVIYAGPDGSVMTSIAIL